MHFGNSAGNFGVSSVRRPVGYDSAAAMSKLAALLPKCMQIVQNWSEKGVVPLNMVFRSLCLVKVEYTRIIGQNHQVATLELHWSVAIKSNQQIPRYKYS